MRSPDAYAYESAKYLADARACAKLRVVSPGTLQKKPTRSRPRVMWPVQRSGPIAALRQSADRVKSVRRRETMQDIHNGISAAQLEGATWRKSQRSNSQGACVELARLDAGTVAMRNSRDPQGSALIYPASAVRAMVSALRTGEFDYLVG